MTKLFFYFVHKCRRNGSVHPRTWWEATTFELYAV